MQRGRVRVQVLELLRPAEVHEEEERYAELLRKEKFWIAELATGYPLGLNEVGEEKE